jgi:subtilase family protein
MGTNYDTTEYQRSTYAVASNAIAAYEAGATGKGIKIGIVDSGINPDLIDFAGRIDPASGDVAGNRGISDEGGHGTAVAAVAAAARNGSNTMGVAFDATIISERADQIGSCATDDGCNFYDDAIASGIDAARVGGAKVINLSLGGSSPGTALLAAMQRAVSAGIVLVIAAGNDGTPNPDAFALTPAQKFPGMVIIAGSIGVQTPTGIDVSQASDFTDKAGTGANNYLMALGFNDLAPDNTGKQFYWSGTSFSAPTISGAVALMAQAFPNLTGQQIVKILFDSADDLGAAGVDSIFGHGRMNIERAFQPVGATNLADSQTPVSLGGNGDLPGAAGDAASAQSLGAVVLDGYDRAYVLNLAATLRRADVDHPLSRSLQNDLKVSSASAGPISIAMTVRERHDLAEGFSLEQPGVGPEDLRKSRLVAGSAIARLDNKTAIAFGFADGAKSMERKLNRTASGAFLVANDISGNPGFSAQRNGSLAIRHQFGGTGVTLSAESGDVWQEVKTSATGSPYRWTSIAADRHLGHNWLSLGLSRLDEKQSLLGGRIGSALGGGGSTSLFLDSEARHDFGNGFSATLNARRGWTDFASGKFQTGAYALDLAKSRVLGRGDKLAFRLAQPLRVEHGGFAMMLPTSWDYATSTATDSLTRMSLSPSGREIDGELSYGSSLIDGRAWFGGNLFYRRDPGHIANSPDDVGGAIRFTFGF